MPRVTFCSLITLVTIIAGCTSNGGFQSSRSGDTTGRTLESVEERSSESVEERSSESVEEKSSLVVDPDSAGRPIDRRLLGTNVPAWLGPDRLADGEFRNLTAASGTTLLRLPGGSWSNYYDWLGCEMGDTETCYWPWAAKPTDFLAFIEALDVPAMWTVSINGTAQEAAALVAFFNGDPSDGSVIGRDARGRDWDTVGTWAQMRADSGFADPVRVDYWEIGNEIYAATPGSGGDDCASFGWEEVWTCDGATYVDGDDMNDGFIHFRDAILAVDPTVQVGAVGVPEADSWGGWGPEVLERVGDELDFYVIHHYGFSGGVQPAEVVGRATDDWSRIVGAVNESALIVGLEDEPRIAVTEYNVVANQDDDSDAVMTEQLGALYVALSIGEMAEAGIGMANHWNLANGQAANGTDYGMIDVESKRRNPAYFAMALWSRFGQELIDVDVDLTDSSGIAGVFAGRGPDGTTTLLIVNASETTEVIAVDPGAAASVTADITTAPSLASNEVAFNGSTNPSTSLEEPSEELGIFDDDLSYDLPGASIVLLTLTYLDDPAAPAGT